MKTILAILAIALSFIFELFGRILAQIASVSMSVATMILSAISKKDE